MILQLCPLSSGSEARLACYITIGTGKTRIGQGQKKETWDFSVLGTISLMAELR